MSVYNLTMKEDITMKNRMIALVLVILMLSALTACGKSEPAPAATEAPAVEAPVEETAPAAGAAPAEEAPVEEAPAPAEAPAEAPGIEPDSGEYTKVSEAKGFSVRFDSKYVASELPGSGNIKIDANTDMTAIPGSIPYVTVSLYSKEDAEDAVSFLKNLADATSDLGKKLETKPGEPKKVELGDRDIYYIFYTYKDTDLNGVIASAFYAENLANGDVAVFNSLALQEDTSVVDGILNLAVNSFTLTK